MAEQNLTASPQSSAPRSSGPQSPAPASPAPASPTKSEPAAAPKAQPEKAAATKANPDSAKPQRAQQQAREEMPPYHVVLLNDDDHSYGYVVEMLQRLFGHSEPFAYQLARTVDHQGRAIVMTTHKERAEFKRDQIRGFGSDPRVQGSSCSMGAVVEPAE